MGSYHFFIWMFFFISRIVLFYVTTIAATMQQYFSLPGKSNINSFLCVVLLFSFVSFAKTANDEHVSGQPYGREQRC